MGYGYTACVMMMMMSIPGGTASFSGDVEASLLRGTG